MNRRRLWASLIGCVGVTVLLLAINLAFSNTPVLGLDLQGGVSVVLSPTEGATGDDLLVIRDLIRDELENRGIAEPDVRAEGSNIVVDLPGVKDQRDALDAVDVAGIVTLRPVFACAGPPDDTSSTVPGSSVPGSVPGSTAPATSAAPASTTPATAAGFGAPAGIARTAGAPPTSPPDAGRQHDARAADDRARGVDHRAWRVAHLDHHPTRAIRPDRAAHDRRQHVPRRSARRRRREHLPPRQRRRPADPAGGLDGRRGPQRLRRGGVERPCLAVLQQAGDVPEWAAGDRPRRRHPVRAGRP